MRRVHAHQQFESHWIALVQVLAHVVLLLFVCVVVLLVAFVFA